MYYESHELPDELLGTVIWAFAYDTNNSEKTMAHRAKPYKCIVIKQDRWTSVCTPLKKDGTLRKSGIVHSYARKYATTYYHAVTGYDGLVYKQIAKLEKLKRECEVDLISHC